MKLEKVVQLRTKSPELWGTCSPITKTIRHILLEGDIIQPNPYKRNVYLTLLDFPYFPFPVQKKKKRGHRKEKKGMKKKKKEKCSPFLINHDDTRIPVVCDTNCSCCKGNTTLGIWYRSTLIYKTEEME